VKDGHAVASWSHGREACLYCAGARRHQSEGYKSSRPQPVCAVIERNIDPPAAAPYCGYGHDHTWLCVGECDRSSEKCDQEGGYPARACCTGARNPGRAGRHIGL
jgi:hypothetical protein